MKPLPDNLPTSNVILGYKDLLGKDTPKDRVSLIEKISKDHIIAELAGLNYRLKGRFSKEVDSKISSQQRELFYFCGKDKKLHDKYVILINKLTGGKKTNLFSRASCMLGIEEVLRSDIPVIPDYKMSASVWEPFLQYMLCVNEYTSQTRKAPAGETVTFESLNPRLLPLAESILLNDPLYIMYRGLLLMDYFAKDNETKDYLKNYFNDTYNLTHERFIFELFQMFFANETQNKDFNFYYIVPEDHPFKHVFDVLSKRYDQEETIKLLDIRKSPFYHRDKGHYVLTDNSVLLDKAYQQFINDFWFDYLKDKKKLSGKSFKFQDYKAIIGHFFEDYVRTIMNYSFSIDKDIILKTFDELKFKDGKKEVEGSDIYIRHYKKVMIAEAKSTSLYDNEKYGGTIEALYKNDRDKFFESFGVDQLATNIKNIAVTMEVVDPDFNLLKKVRIWPVIVFNDKALQSPLMAQIFNKRFKELLGNYKKKGVFIYPLTLVHIGDLEQAQGALHKNSNRLWELLSYNFHTRFLPPFYNTLNRNNIKHDYSPVRNRVLSIFEMFGVKEHQLKN